jgi:hypothetical protein
MEQIIMGNPALVIAIVAQALAIIGVVVRLYKVTTPLHNYIPAKWRWLPEAIVGTCGTLTALLPMAQDWVAFGEGIVAAVVTFVGFAVAGYHAPEEKRGDMQLRYDINVDPDSVENAVKKLDRLIAELKGASK